MPLRKLGGIPSTHIDHARRGTQIAELRRRFWKNIFVKNFGAPDALAPSLAPLTAEEEYCAVAALERPIMKKKEDARLAVLREYDTWAKDHPNDAKKMGGYVFFGYLEKERPDLLDFRAVDSKWLTIHGWLRHGGRLKD